MTAASRGETTARRYKTPKGTELMETGRRPISRYYRDEFGRLARYYDFGLRTTYVVVGGEQKFRRAIVEAAEVEPGHNVLDVGCGTGTLVGMLAERVGPEGHVVGIDLSDAMLAVARRKHKAANVEFVKANAEDLPFEDETFDRVTISLAFHEMNWEGRQNALTEMYRVLKPSGLVVVADMRKPDTSFTHLLTWFIDLVETDTLTDFRESGLYREMHQAGLKDLRRQLAGKGFFEIVSGRKN